MAERRPIEHLTERDTRDVGVRCPRCDCRHCPSIGGMIRHFKSATRKKRRCRHCGNEFWTLEQIVEGDDDASSTVNGSPGG